MPASEKVNQVARSVGRAPAQVLLRRCIRRELPVITESTHRERIAENARRAGRRAALWTRACRRTRPRVNGIRKLVLALFA
jgi:hypothetical protein